MFDWRCCLALSLALMLTSGCSPEEPQSPPTSAVEALRRAERFEMFSLDPSREPEIMQGTFTGERYGYCGILGSTTVSDPAVSKELSETLQEAIDAWDRRVARCFWPRHMIRFTLAGQQHELVICFECGAADWNVDGELRESIHLADQGKPVFDRVLQAANVPLPKN